MNEVDFEKDDELLPEYDFRKMGTPQMGKYARRYYGSNRSMYFLFRMWRLFLRKIEWLLVKLTGE